MYYKYFITTKEDTPTHHLEKSSRETLARLEIELWQKKKVPHKVRVGC